MRVNSKHMYTRQSDRKTQIDAKKLTRVGFDAFLVDAIFADGTVVGDLALGVGGRQVIRVGLLSDGDLSTEIH